MTDLVFSPGATSMFRWLGCWMLLGCWLAAASVQAASGALGTSAAIDSDGRLWIAHVESGEPTTHVLVARSDDSGATWRPQMRVTAQAEPVSGDGENRPKIAFGPQRDVYVSWTSPTSAKYTAEIRFARSLDGGATWSAPITVHHDRQVIAHRFESMLVDAQGRIWLAWVDKRDLERAQESQTDYAGAAIYYTYSSDRGATWRVERKLADHTCECCRIALSRDQEGRAVALWRHVFANSERDHAVAVLEPSREPVVVRATHDRWRVEACPHHGPSLAIAPNGVRHAVWFNQVANEGRAFYGQLSDAGPTKVRQLPVGAAHADVATAGDVVAVAWKRFDGEATRVESWVSNDGGKSFQPGPTLQTRGASDQPRLLAANDAVVLVWRRAEDVAVRRLSSVRMSSIPDAATATEARNAPSRSAIQPFTRTTLADIERQHRGKEFWLVLWDLECGYCMKSLKNLAAAQRAQPSLRAVTIATDSMGSASELQARLAELGVESSPFAFADEAAEALRFVIDPAWMGEKPRAYHYDASGKREAVTGVIAEDRF